MIAFVCWQCTRRACPPLSSGDPLGGLHVCECTSSSSFVFVCARMWVLFCDSVSAWTFGETDWQVQERRCHVVVCVCV
jgi:hypothetical protein